MKKRFLSIILVMMLIFGACSKSDSSDEKGMATNSIDKFVGKWKGTIEYIPENPQITIPISNCKKNIEMNSQKNDGNILATISNGCNEDNLLDGFYFYVEGNSALSATDGEKGSKLFTYSFENANKLIIEMNNLSYVDTDKIDEEVEKLDEVEKTPEKIAEITSKYTTKYILKMLLIRQ